MPKAATRPRAPADGRTRKMRAVLAACRRHGLDDDARREVQLEVTGQSSMAEMSENQLGQLLDHLNRDWQGSNPSRPHVAKIKALWWSLYWLGAIDEPGDQALSAFVKRQTGIAALRFLDHRKAHSVIEALKSWLEREGVKWHSDAEIADLAVDWPGRGKAEWDRWSVFDAIAQRLFWKDIVRDARQYATKALAFAEHWSRWNPRQIDEAIQLIGRKWRAERPRS